ncbi:hypothetical protein CSOJ01_14928 [Colletotrichum sojae]|uniref:Uncharacterized protein n=1 Tax=Colletotrichum sojae TaxID=2175907 RepID=A0A8H6MJJ3_9PEZI|nr:hypothetical protein CSOJ01_14928 [Colletotrichum sojae]
MSDQGERLQLNRVQQLQQEKQAKESMKEDIWDIEKGQEAYEERPSSAPDGIQYSSGARSVSSLCLRMENLTFGSALLIPGWKILRTLNNGITNIPHFHLMFVPGLSVANFRLRLVIRPVLQ